MNRRDFLKSLPALPLLAAAPALKEDETEIRADKLVARIPSNWSPRKMQQAVDALTKFESGEIRTLVFTDDATLYRVP